MMKFLLIACVAAVVVSCIDAKPRFKPRLDGRIVGGETTTIEEYPYQISLEYYGSHRCGGSVVNASVIVTAAHCVDGIAPSNLAVRAGTTTKGSGGVVIKVARSIAHENYNYFNIDYDVAVLHLAEPLTLSKQISPVALPNENEEAKVNASAVVTGWGALKSGGSSPRELQRVSVPIVDQQVCQNAYGSSAITPRMICAGVVGVGGKDACQGDSGGPMVTNGKLHGIVSWGRGCAEKNYPGVYTRVSAVRAWIRKHGGL